MGKLFNKKETIQEEHALVQQDKRTASELVSIAVDKATTVGKFGVGISTNVLTQAASGVSKGMKDLSEKAKEDSYNKRLKKYNPLFPEAYHDSGFCIPNIIQIVDDAVRKDIDVCQNAIGWRATVKGTEILFLYDEYVEHSGLQFVPAPACDELYYIDPFERNKFIKLDYLFQYAQEEKVAELERVAYALGAKKCTVEFVEKEIQRDRNKKELHGKEEKGKQNQSQASIAEEYSVESSKDMAIYHSSKSEATFKGNGTVFEPTLKWFAHDHNIRNLIDYRCKGDNEIMAKTLEISGSSAATISKKAACSIDAAVAGMNLGQDYAMENKSIRETDTRIIYRLEF